MKIETSPYSKTVYVWNSVSATFFYGVVTPPHSHNTMQFVFDLRKTFKCRVGNGEWGIYKSVIIKENAIHQLDTNDSVQLLLYLDAECELANDFREKYLAEHDISSLDVEIMDYVRPGELERCLIEPDPELLEQLIHHLLNKLVNNQKKEICDQRIKNVIKLLAADSTEKMSIGYLAQKVFLSESRLRFLFKKSTGVPLHRYIFGTGLCLLLTES